VGLVSVIKGERLNVNFALFRKIFSLSLSLYITDGRFYVLQFGYTLSNNHLSRGKWLNKSPFFYWTHCILTRIRKTTQVLERRGRERNYGNLTHRNQLVLTFCVFLTHLDCTLSRQVCCFALRLFLRLSLLNEAKAAPKN
jgi:hypothetical protein